VLALNERGVWRERNISVATFVRIDGPGAHRKGFAPPPPGPAQAHIQVAHRLAVCGLCLPNID
jgi:hypothetical protein